MHFPKYWARGEWIGTQPKGQKWQQLAWDHSDISVADAKSRADLKAQTLGQSANRSRGERQDSYAYVDRPVREPVLRTFGEEGADGAAVITRTAYGSEVLNTAGLMFIDIDLPVASASSSTGFVAMLKRLFYGRPAETAPTPGLAEARLAVLRQWQIANPAWLLRVYRTHSGLRCLVTSAWQDPVADLTHTVFASLDCDTRYRQLCKVQKSFRARLTPKPWRCGCPNPPVRFPYETGKSEARMNQWVARYQQSSEKYATCQFLAEIGTTVPLAELAPLVTEHDTRTKAASGLPLA